MKVLQYSSAPRLVVAGLSGDSGKTLVSLGLVLVAKSGGIPVRTFKKGPDYIDAAWLAWASGSPARNLDSFLMGFDGARSSFAAHALPEGLNLIEGNRGLFDGVDARGTHSTAGLAKELEAPVVLVVNATKTTRTAAALVLGCQKLDPDVRLAGVVLNQVGGTRHETVLREAIESACAVPILGVLPRLADNQILPGRHLGLVTPAEHPRIRELEANLVGLVSEHLDVQSLMAVAESAPLMPVVRSPQIPQADGRGLRIGYVSDSAFTFYYPENLEALSSAGADLISVSPLSSASLPGDLDALYIGGGFPETHGAELTANRPWPDSLCARAAGGLPIYAECGGLMLLARAIRWQGNEYPMAGVLPLAVEVCATPQGHGYTELTVDRPNPFFPEGLALKGHEFHYSRIVPEHSQPPTACAVRRGTGCGDRRDGVVIGNVWASYTHLHALGTPEWANGLLTAAKRFKDAAQS